MKNVHLLYFVCAFYLIYIESRFTIECIKTTQLYTLKHQCENGSPPYHTFIKSHLQYCPLVWANQSKRGMSSLEKLQERGLRFVYNNYTTPYVNLLRKAHIPSVSTAWQRSAVIEVYKALNGLSPKYMQCMFTLNKTNHNLRSDNKIILPKCHTTNFGLKSFAYQA